MSNTISRIKESIIKIHKLERYYFYFFLLLNLVPVLHYRFFPTVDGPAHLYNSTIIVELLQNGNSSVKQFFDFNNHITPNWSGHFLLAVFLFFLPSFLAEKLVLLVYLIGLPLSIRYVFKAINTTSNYLVYLTFPFTYSFLFYYGFYNFNIGLVLLFFGLGYWLKYRNNLKFSRALIVMLIAMLICLSHLMVFVIFLIILLIFNIENLYNGTKRKEIDKSNVLNYLFLQFFSILPGLIIVTNFIFSNQSLASTYSYIPYKDIITSIKYIMPIKGIKYEGYGLSSRLILYSFVTLISSVLLLNLFHWISKRELLLKNKTWIFLCLVMLGLLFILPDSIPPNGFISSRLLLLFFLFLIIALAGQEVPFLLKSILFLAINGINLLILFHNYKAVSEGCRVAAEINSASKLIAPYSTVLPINNSKNSLYTHISNYLGADKPVIILENYEARLDHFPLKWKKDKFTIGTTATVKDYFKQNQRVDYIFIIKDMDNEEDSKTEVTVNQLLENEYTELFTDDRGAIKLFKSKNATRTF